MTSMEKSPTFWRTCKGWLCLISSQQTQRDSITNSWSKENPHQFVIWKAGTVWNLHLINYLNGLKIIKPVIYSFSLHWHMVKLVSSKLGFFQLHKRPRRKKKPCWTYEGGCSCKDNTARTGKLICLLQLEIMLHEGLRGMKTGGVYLKDELLEEEKHECPQRKHFFLGRPGTIYRLWE